MKLKLLLLLATLAVAATTEPQQLAHVLHALNAFFVLQHNIYLNFEQYWQHYSSAATVLQQQTVPYMQLKVPDSGNNSYNLLGKHDTRALIIVHVTQLPLPEKLANYLPILLWNLHHLHIVFVSRVAPTRQFYAYCWQNGFINVLLMHNATLHSYRPYPQLQSTRLAKLGDYLHRAQDLSNFLGYPIRLLLFSTVPRIMQYTNRQGQLIYAGYMYNMFREFIRHYNGTLQHVVMPQQDITTSLMAIERKQADLICYPRELSLQMSATLILCKLNNYIIVPYARPLDSYLYFIKPFAWTLWCGLVGVFVYGALLLFASLGSRTAHDISQQFLISLRFLLYVPQPSGRPRNWQQGLIHVQLGLTGFILTNFYLALLSSMLTTGLYERQYNTLQDLVAAPYKLVHNEFYAKLLQNATVLPKVVRQRIVIVPNAQLNAMRQNLTDNFMYSAYEDRLDIWLYQQHLLTRPRFKIIREDMLNGYMSWPVPDGLPFLTQLNVYLRRIFEHGILLKLKNDAWLESIAGGMARLFKDEGKHFRPHDLKFFSYAFAIWGVGLTIASLCLLVELRWQQQRAAQKAQN